MVSVIIPIYNVENYVEQAVRSVLNQTFRDIEVIAVDDGSPDRSGEICDRIAAEDKRLKVIHKPNGGVGSARNAGLAAASGEYIMFLDGDDYYVPDTIEYLYNLLINTGADMTFGREQCVNDADEPVTMDSQPVDNDRRSLENPAEIVLSEYDFWKQRNKACAFVIVTSKIYPRQLLKDISFNRYAIHEDEEILQHIIPQCSKIIYSEKAVLCYRMRAGSATHKGITINDLSFAELLKGEMNYFRSKGWKDLELYAFGMGARNIEVCYYGLDLSDSDIKKQIDNMYKDYREIAAEIATTSDSFLIKIRMRLFRFSLPLYAKVRKLVKR